MDRDKTSGKSEQDDGGNEQTVVATHVQIYASGMVKDQNCLEEIQYLLEVRVNIRDQASVKALLSDFNESSNCTFNMQSGKPDRVSEAEEQRCKYSGSIKCCMKVVCSDKKELQLGKITSWSSN